MTPARVAASSRPRMTAARAYAIVGLSLATAGAIGTALVRVVAPAPFIPVGFGFGGATMVGFVIEGLSWAAVGAVLVLRRPGNAVGWLMVPVGVGYVLSQLTACLTFAFAVDGTAQGDRLAQIAGWATVLLQLVGIFQLAVGFYYPTGRAQSRGWAQFMRFYWAFAIVFVAISLTQPGPLQLMPALENPFGFGPDLRGDRPLAPILSVFTAILFVALGLSMIARYRSGSHVERQQQKWFVLALSVSAIGLGIATWEAMFSDRPANAIGLTIYVFAGVLVPFAIGIAILRYHLYDIDRIISRTLGWAVLTGTLLVVFVGAGSILQGVLAAIALRGFLGGFTQGETLAVAASTLLAFALFQPLRQRVQRVVDRRFYRARYNADRTALGFGDRLRDETDMETVTQDLVRTAELAVAPTSSSIWLRRGHA